MEQRESGMVEIMSRLGPLFTSYPLKYLERVPEKQVMQEDMPCVLVLEGEDIIDVYASGGYLGYPAKRIFNPIIEVWDLSSGNVNLLWKQTMALVLANKGVLLKGVAIREKKTVGPFNLGLPGCSGKSTTFEMRYNDEGPFA